MTALAALPNTSLVLSASQDGTLRTWDLQAAAQVGEVALSCWDRDVASARVNRLLAPAGPSWPVLSLSASSVELWRVRELYSPLAQLSAPVLHLQVVSALPPLPLLPARLVCACADGSVYLVSVATGRAVSALLLEPDDCAASVLYCLPREALWLLTRAGHLVCANAARCPMRVLHRVCPPPAPAPRPCCLHLYSHLTDPGGAFASWEAVCRHGGEPCLRDLARARKDKNRWVPEPATAGRGGAAVPMPTRCCPAQVPARGGAHGRHPIGPGVALLGDRLPNPGTQPGPRHRHRVYLEQHCVLRSISPLPLELAWESLPCPTKAQPWLPSHRRRLDREDVARLPLCRGEPEPAAYLFLLPPGRGALCAREANHCRL